MNNLNPEWLFEKDLNWIFLEINTYINKVNWKIISILENFNWDVHLVYKISTDNSSYFLKVRWKSSRKYNEELINPKDIKKEKLALDLLYNLFPDNFPNVLFYNESKNFFLMGDVINSWTSFIDFLNWQSHIIELEKYIIELWSVLWKIHYSLWRKKFSDNDSNYNYINRVDIILWNNSNSASIIEALKKEKKQLILWDLSPKNIWVNENHKPVFFDFEHFWQWSCIFEVAFLSSHIYLHLYNLKNSKKILNLFLTSYNESNKDFEINELFWKIFYSSINYRVWIYPMKYNVSLSSDSIKKIREESENYLR